MDGYKTVEGTATASIVEKKSEFIAALSFADSEEKALAFLERVKAQNRTARHHVYAYVLREGNRTRCSDDGEPQKTAGVPTLEVLQHAQLTDCVLVTTRYFGGILLGTGGLVRAYTGAASAAVQAAHVVTMRTCVQGTLRVAYPLYEQAARIVEQAGAQLRQAEFARDVTLPFVMPAGGETQLEASLQELCRGAADLTFSQPYYAPF